MRWFSLAAVAVLLSSPVLAGGKTAGELLVEGGKLYSVGQCEAALQPLRAALEKKPELAQAHRLLGECLAKIDRCEEAIPHLEQALEADPRHSDNSRTMDAMVGCERVLRQDERTQRTTPAAQPDRAGVPDAAPDDSVDWHEDTEAQPASVATAAEPDDISAEMVGQEGMEAPDREQLHWYGAGAIGLGLGLVLVAAIVVEDYSGWERDVANDRCVKPNGSLKEGGCPDNGWAYGLWGVGGAFVIAGGVLMLLHDWSKVADADEPASESSAGLSGVRLGADRRGAFLNFSGRF